MSTEELTSRVTDFLARELAIDRATIRPDTTLFGDLGVDGADGWELIERFADTFGVDVTSFRADVHFGPEAGATPWSMILYWLRFLRARDKSPEDRHRLTPIRCADLVAAGRRGAWRAHRMQPS